MSATRTTMAIRHTTVRTQAGHGAGAGADGRGGPCRPSGVRAWLAAALLATGGAVAQAQIVNGGFEAGPAGWSLAGDASVAALLVDEGAQALWLGTEAVADGLNVSGIEPLLAGGDLEAALGLAAGDLDTPDGWAAEGSLARQSFSAQDGDYLRLRWNFSTADTSLDAGFADYAFVVLDGTLHRLASTLGATAGGVAATTSGYAHETGWHTTWLRLSGTGTHTLAFGVLDLGDHSQASALAVDGVTLAVPEPGAATLMLGGLGVLGWGRRRRARTL